MMITVQNVLTGMMISLRRGDNVLNSINKIDGVVDGMRSRLEFHQQKRGNCRWNETTQQKTSDAIFASLVLSYYKCACKNVSTCSFVLASRECKWAILSPSLKINKLGIPITS